MTEREDKFFKGPWQGHYHFDPYRNIETIIIESESDDPGHKGADIAEFNLNEWDDDEEKTVVATAKLIAAAPDLYQALNGLFDWITDELVLSIPIEHRPKPKEISDRLRPAIDAIHKARGQL